MPNLYARATALTNVVGRIDYVSNHHRQERLLAAYDGAADLLGGNFWRQLATESQVAFEQFGYKKRAGHEKELECCEGREIMIMLSNALLQRMTPDEIVKTVVDVFQEQLGLTVAAGLHLKHKKDGPDNLHVHVILPERELLKEPVVKIAERALFFDAKGKRRYKKSEILDENKQLLPGCRIVKKGEIYEQHYFGSVDPKYSSKAWMKHVKTDVILPLRNGKLRGDVEITEFDYGTGKLPQQHIGTMEYIDDPDAKNKVARILETNDLILKYNRLVDTGVIPLRAAREYQLKVLQAADRKTALREVLREVKQKQTQRNQQQGRRIRTKKDWEAQRMVDAVRVAREVGAKNSDDLEKALRLRGQELGQAKREFERAQEEGNIEDVMKAAEKVREATKRYSEAARATESLQRNSYRPPIEPDDR